MATPTQGNLFQKPQEGLDDNTWGTTLNANLDKLDALLSGREPVPSLDATVARVRGRLRMDTAPVVGWSIVQTGVSLDIDADTTPVVLINGSPRSVDARGMNVGQIVDLIFLNPASGPIIWNGTTFANGVTAPGALPSGTYIRLFGYASGARGFKLTA